MSELLKFAVLVRCIMHLYIINIQVLCTSSLSIMLKIFFWGGGGGGGGFKKKKLGWLCNVFFLYK